METCTSPYPSRDELTDGQSLTLIIAFTILTPMTLLLNGFLIYGLYKTNQYRNVFSRFIMVLSMSDFCIGLFVQPVVIYLFIPGRDNCAASWYLTLSGYVFLNFSGLVIFMVSIDRFFRLRRSNGYTQKVTLNKVNLALASAFIFSILTAIAAYVSAIYNFFCIFNMSIISINFISATGILNFYFLAWRNVRKRISSIRNVSTRCSTHSAQFDISTSDKKSETHRVKGSLMSVLSKSKLSLVSRRTRPHYDAAMTRTVAAILVCCCATYPPYFIVSFYRSVMFTLEGHCDRKSHPTNIWFFWSFFLMFLNCVINVILYSCHNRQLKDLLRSMTSCLSGDEGSSTSEKTNEHSLAANILKSKQKPSFV
ncbi:5-hydroxytryptamine receptor 1B-like [Clytia hemisphaerica]